MKWCGQKPNEGDEIQEKSSGGTLERVSVGNSPFLLKRKGKKHTGIYKVSREDFVSLFSFGRVREIITYLWVDGSKHWKRKSDDIGEENCYSNLQARDRTKSSGQVERLALANNPSNGSSIIFSNEDEGKRASLIMWFFILILF